MTLTTLVALVAVTVGLVLTVTTYASASSLKRYETVAAHKGSVTQRVTVSGTIEPMTQTALSFGTNGIVDFIYVQPGQRVRPGQILARLNMTVARAKLLQAQDLLLSDKAKLSQDLAGPTPEVVQSDQAAIAVAKDRLAAAQQNLSSTLAANAVALTQGKATLGQAQTSLAIDQSGLLAQQQRFATVQALVAPSDPHIAMPVPVEPVASNYGLAATQGLISFDQSYLGADQAALAAADLLKSSCTSQVCSYLAQSWISQDNEAIGQANDSIFQANSVIEDLRSVSDSESRLSGISANNIFDLDNAQHVLNQAELALSSARSNAAITEQSAAPAVVAADQASVVAAKHALIAAQLVLADSQIVAPTSGIVGEINISVGQEVSLFYSTAGDIILEGSGPFEVDASVGDSSIGQVHLGQEVLVTVVGHASPFRGIVNQITPMATVVRGVAEFPISVLLDGTHHDLFAGSSAEIKIIVAHRRNVVLVPTSCIHTSGGSSYVKVLEDGRAVRKMVHVGVSSGIYTQISSGLHIGEAVILAKVDQPLPTVANLAKARKALGQNGGIPKAPKISPLARVKPKR